MMIIFINAYILVIVIIKCHAGWGAAQRVRPPLGDKRPAALRLFCSDSRDDDVVMMTLNANIINCVYIYIYIYMYICIYAYIYIYIVCMPNDFYDEKGQAEGRGYPSRRAGRPARRAWPKLGS